MKIELKDAILVLQEELAKDKSPGSYYHSWQSNIAMAFQDEFTRRGYRGTINVPAISNIAAKNFLDLLIMKPEENSNEYEGQ